jgi:4-carboxymuconolactone decarboxylase
MILAADLSAASRSMRLPLLPPDRLDETQKALYVDMKGGIETRFGGFSTIREDGALLGPWNPWLHEPKFGGPIWELVKALSYFPSLPRPVREVAILVAGAAFRAAYEIYAHSLLGEKSGLSEAKIATIVAGQRPTDLSPEEAIAYDVAAGLMRGGVLPELTYQAAVRAFAVHGAAELIYLVGLYAFVSTTLNGFDVPIPEQQS